MCKVDSWHVSTKGFRPWLINDHGTPLFERDHREIHGLKPPKSSEGTNPWCEPKFPPQIMSGLPSGADLEIFPTFLINIIHTCHVEFHVDLSSGEDVVGCGQNYPSCKPETGARAPLNQLELKDSQEPWPNSFRVKRASSSMTCFT